MSEGKTNALNPVNNKDLEEIIQSIKEGTTPEKQQKLLEILMKARLLSPCFIDEKVRTGQAKPKADSVRLFLLNTNDGKTFLPVFTSMEKTSAIQFKEETPQYLVHTLKEFSMLFSAKDSKLEGLIINPNVDQYVIPKNLVVLLANSMQPKPAEQQNRVVRPVYGEPRVYPTRMVTAVYDTVSDRGDVQKVWLKQKLVGPVMTFVFIVEADGSQDEIANAIKETAAPLSKGIGVDVVFYNEFVENEIVKGSVALFDRELEL